MAPLPVSPSSGGATTSPRLSHSKSSEWNVVVQRNIKSSLLLVLVLSAVFAFSILDMSHSFGAGTTDEALTQSRLDMSRLTRLGDDDQSDEAIAPADSNLSPQQSTHADISLPSANTSTAVVPTPSTPEESVQFEEKCDISLGRWVRDPSGPIYTNLTCPMLPDTKNCQKFNKQPDHLYWRWEPYGCDLPRFSPDRFLDVVRGKTLAFIGDSLARNQMESLLCLLSQAEMPTDVYRDAFDKFRSWHFPAHNFTLTVMWTEFFAHATPVVAADGEPTGAFDIHLDRLNANWTSRLPALDYAVISGGSWFFRTNYLWEGGRRVGCVNCGEANLTDLGMAYAVRRVVRAAVEGIARCEDCKSGLVTFLRTYAPDHFEHGHWNSHGYCNRTRPFEERELMSNVKSIGWELRRVQREEVRRARETSGSKRFAVLDITKAMMLRPDGHPNWNWPKWSTSDANDCLHWCLPGPIDMWSDVLLQRLVEISPPPVGR